MVSSLKMTPWLMAVFCLVTAGCSNVTDQQTSESQRDQVAILKQIRKVNEDGSYSFGYEAGDGSFKVESRDVLGNIKGTFGFVDADGEIKRVSYSSSNGTGFKATSVSPLQEHVSVVQSIPRVNRSSTTRKPTVTYATSTESSSSKSSTSSVVQAIPRTRKTSSMSSTAASTSSTTTNSPTESPRPIFGHYVKATSRSRPRFVINGQQRPAAVEEDTSEDSQITRPSTEEKAATYRRILFAKRPIDHSLRPITEEFEEKEEEPKITTGNTLRRQLHEDTTKHEPVQDTVNNNNNDEQPDVYSSGSLSTTRPLFTTTTPSRLIHRISTLRTDRPKTVYINRDSSGAGRFESSNKYESPRVYEEESKLMPEEREAPQQILFRGPQRPLNENREYARQQHQSNEPVYQHPKPYLREVFPTGVLVQQSTTEEDPAYRTGIPIGRILYRPHPSQQPLYASTTDSNDHYLTETPITEPDEETHVPMVQQNYARPRAFQRPPVVYADQDATRQRVLLRPLPQPPMPHQPIDDRDYPAPVTPDYPHRSNPMTLPPELPNPIALPLSRRDFQILLRRLLVSQYGAEALSYPRTYLEDALYDQQPYPTYQPAYQSPVPRQALAYDPAALPRRYGDRIPLPRHGYSRAINPLYQPQAYDDYDEGRYAKRVYRQKFYTREVEADAGDEILPPAIREALLLRMLQLAINAERPTVATMMATTTAMPTSVYRKTGPVRSVQIISDDDDDEGGDMRKKT